MLRVALSQHPLRKRSQEAGGTVPWIAESRAQVMLGTVRRLAGVGAHIPHGFLLILEILRSAGDRFPVNDMPKAEDCCHFAMGKRYC